MKRDGIKAITLRPNHFELVILDALKEHTGERTYSKAIIRSAIEFDVWRRRAETAENKVLVLRKKIEDICTLEGLKTVTDKLREKLSESTLEISMELIKALSESTHPAAQGLSKTGISRLAEVLSESTHPAAQGLSESHGERAHGISRLAEVLSESTHPAAQGLSESHGERAHGISRLAEVLSESTHPAAQGLSKTGISGLAEIPDESTHPAARGLNID